ncbi:PspA/IM30 family protein [cf. Phormidesmis sp. LEGE 11477]|uniref:PspA/IM30 family protein n=1 Tax=cf. Phormidesmis sp. LEGE 11477 TaxID=1828680 RepID=UPI0018806D64|nr:PspA/IM30 family protein [cf. Phormidesmis sp. LEGE 11477]MBE9064642.1 PspA/IM30 family protein [cf. Phormidesmis sp. LEGE 11477]
MGLLDRISRLVRSNVNTLVNGAEDPEKILQQTLQDMQRDLIAMRQAVAQAIATQKRTERQCEQAERTAQEWYNRAQLALQKGDDPIARDALERRQTYSQTVQTLRPQIVQQKEIVRQLKSNMSLLERKIAEARTKKDMYIARARAAQSSVRLHEMLMSNAPGATGAFEKMESRVLDLEAQAEVAGTIGVDDVEKQFAQLEGQGNVDAQLAEMKAKMIEGQ